MSVHFTSDLHFGHRKVAEIRGFESVERHDSVLIDRWRDSVADNDVVWVLGDLAASSPTHALGVLSKLPGRKRLIAGNHDKCHPMYRDAHRWQRKYLDVFESVQAFARASVLGRHVLLSHFPYEADHTDPPRHMPYRLRNEGMVLLHGHTHSSRTTTGPREIHVGVDAWAFAPARDVELAECIEAIGPSHD